MIEMPRLKDCGTIKCGMNAKKIKRIKQMPLVICGNCGIKIYTTQISFPCRNCKEIIQKNIVGLV